MKNYRFWLQVNDSLALNNEVILMLVVAHEGSSPGKQGFKMFIDSAGNQFGTIGGGIMEANIINEAEDMLKSPNFMFKQITQLHHKRGAPQHQSGLICSGKQWLILKKITTQQQEVIKQIILCYEDSFSKLLLVNKESFILQDDDKVKSDLTYDTEYSTDYLERVGDPVTVHVFGGGHVGNAITRILSTLNFFIIQYDDREDLNQFEQNSWSTMKITGSFSKIADKVKESKKTYVVVTTYSFDTDFEVLATLINKKVNYIGLMGSKAKIAKIFQMLREVGVPTDRLNQIKAPIGLNISNGSIEEIAISVASELLEIKNNPEKGIYPN